MLILVTEYTLLLRPLHNGLQGFKNAKHILIEIKNKHWSYISYIWVGSIRKHLILIRCKIKDVFSLKPSCDILAHIQLLQTFIKREAVWKKLTLK